MKKKVMLALLAVAVALPMFGVASALSANNMRTGERVVVKKDETIDRNLYVFGNDVEVAGTVDGDVYCVGTNSVTVSGKVKGDILCASPTVKIDGQVDGDVRVAGQAVSLKGDITGNASAFADTFTLEDGSRVRDITTMANTTVINGKVMRDLVANGESTAVNTKVGRDITATNRRLALGGQSNVGGNIFLVSDNKIDKAQSAQVAGKITETPATDPSTNYFLEFVVALITAVASAVLMAMVVLAIAPKALQAATNNGTKGLGASFLVGAGTLIVLPIVAVFSFMTLIGALTGILLLVLIVVLLFISFPIAAFLLGRLLLQKNTSNIVYYMLLGASIIAVTTFLPIVNSLVVIAVAFLGAGTVVREVFARNRTAPAKVATTKAKPTKK